MILAQRRWEVIAQDTHLSLFAARRFLATRLLVDLDRLFSSFDFLARDPDHEVVIDPARSATLLARPDELTLEQGERAQGHVVALPAGIDHF